MHIRSCCCDAQLKKHCKFFFFFFFIYLFPYFSIVMLGELRNVYKIFIIPKLPKYNKIMTNEALSITSGTI